MLRAIALVVAMATTAAVAGAQAKPTVSKSAVKTGALAKSGTPRRTRRAKKIETQAELQKEARISEATARATALNQVSNGTVKSVELEREHGKLIYSYDISVAGKTGIEEVAINAIDGSVVAHEHETPKMERKEAAQEAKEKKAKK
jgi:uncharacterized membrane protein YkoI